MTEPKEPCPGCEHFSESEKLREELRQRDLQIDGLKKELGETQSAAIKWKENSDILERICTLSGKHREEAERLNGILKKALYEECRGIACESEGCYVGYRSCSGCEARAKAAYGPGWGESQEQGKRDVPVPNCAACHGAFPGHQPGCPFGNDGPE